MTGEAARKVGVSGGTRWGEVCRCVRDNEASQTDIDAQHQHLKRLDSLLGTAEEGHLHL